MPEIRLLTAEKTRSRLTIQQQRYIKKLYQQAVEDVKDWEKSLKGKDNVSSVIRREYLNQMRKDLNEEMEKIGSDVESTIKSNISATATAVVKDANSVLNGLGVSVKGAYSFVPSDVVQAITTGQVYDASWTLSKAIWAHTKKSQQDIYDIIAKGVAENKSSYEIAKQLEIYVNPSALKPWDWGKLYPGSSKVVDYNAQRLARTLVSHAYQQSFVRTTKDNPFFEGYRWLISGHDVCPICTDYAYDDHTGGKLPEGVFYKDELPMDHPNGRCTFSVYMSQSTDEIVDSLIDWAHGEENKELDQFAESLGFQVTSVKNGILNKPTIPASFTALRGGKGDPEVTDSIYDYHIPDTVREKLKVIESMRTYAQFKDYFSIKGISLESGLSVLEGVKSTEEIKSVYTLLQKIAVGVETYESEFGPNALSALKKVVIYDEKETSLAAYYFNKLGENDSLAGSIRFRDWNADGRAVFHELAHAFQDSNKHKDEDALKFSDRIARNVSMVKFPGPRTTYTDESYNAEKMADIFGYGFFKGNESNINFIEDVLHYMNKSKI